MDLKRLITHFTYRIEAKPGGGFIAHASDPNLPPLEAATRFELNEKIRQNISAALAAEFPQLKSAMEQNQVKVAFHLEQKSGGGFVLHSDAPNATPMEAAPHEIESKFAEKLIEFAGKHLVPAEISQALASNLASGNVKVFVTKTGGHATTLFAAGAPAGSSPTSPISENSGALENTASEFPDTAGTITDAGDGSPIHRTTSSNWALLRFLLALAILGAIAYFYLSHR